MSELINDKVSPQNEILIERTIQIMLLKLIKLVDAFKTKYERDFLFHAYELEIRACDIEEVRKKVAV